MTDLKSAHIPDEQLVRQSQAGDNRAFSLLVTRHRLRVQRTLLAAGILPDEVEDVVQEAFLHAYLSLDDLRQPSSFRAWVCGIGLNIARTYWRQRPFGQVPWAQIRDLPAQGSPTPEQAAARRLQLDQLNAAIADLPPSEREALLLVYRDGLSHRETAVSLGITLSAVKVRVHRGRRRLQDQLRATPAPKPPPAKEIPMLSAQIIDVLVPVVADARLGIKKEEVLAPVLATLPAKSQQILLAAATISVNLATYEAESALMQSLDEAQRNVMRQALAPFLPHHVVVLQTETDGRLLPIWVGPCEGQLIAIHLRDQPIKRPLTGDLIRTLLSVSDTRVTRAAVSKLHDNIYYGTLTVETANHNGPTELDCRPSDALVLATRLDVPIFVAPAVMEAQGLPAEAMDGHDPAHVQLQTGKKFPQRDWRSLLRP